MRDRRRTVEQLRAKARSTTFPAERDSLNAKADALEAKDSPPPWRQRAQRQLLDDLIAEGDGEHLRAHRAGERRGPAYRASFVDDPPYASPPPVDDDVLARLDDLLRTEGTRQDLDDALARQAEAVRAAARMRTSYGFVTDVGPTPFTDAVRRVTFTRWGSGNVRIEGFGDDLPWPD